MRIAIDYTPALRQGAGIGRYTRGLVGGLACLPAEHRYVLFSAGTRPDMAGLPDHFTARHTMVPARWLTLAWHRVGLPIPAEWLAGGCDLFHSTDFALPPLARARGIVTVHDLSYLRRPECADPGLREYLTRVVPPAVARAAHVLADSENTRRDLAELLDVAPAKVSVVTAGIEPRFRPERRVERLAVVRRRYSLPERFILSVGTLEPRKNHARLIEACAMLWERDASAPSLVIAGGRGWLYEDIQALIGRLGVADRVHFPGFVADEDLPALYTLSELFVFPSLYEGFGIPPLEAMACGTPTITSDNSSLPEAVGDAALMVPAEDEEALAGRMAEVLEDQGLREHLVATGRQRAALFTWERAAAELVRAYRRAAEA